VELDVVPLDVCGVVFGSPYMYMRDVIFMWRENQYHLIKDGKSYIINAHKGKSKISLVSANQAKKLISSSKKYVFLFLRENQSGEESSKSKGIPGGMYKRKNNSWRSCCRHTKECSRSLKGYHLRGKWSMRYNCFLTPHYQILGCIDSLFWKQMK
jgi:hypothetical protein